MKEQLPRVRTTVWPGGEVAVPPVHIDTVTLDGEWLQWSAPTTYPVDLPSELYLRDLWNNRLDVDNPADLLGFAKQWGIVGLANFVEIRPRHAYYGTPTGVHQWLDLDPVFRERLEAKVEERLRHQPGLTRERRGWVHIDEMRTHVRLLRDMTRIMWAYRGHIYWQDVVKLWESHDFAIASVLARGHDPEADLMWFLGEQLNQALRPFSVRVMVETTTDDSLTRMSIGQWEVTTYAALCLQLMNHLATNATFHVCKNERCRRTFVHQTGRTETGVRRTKGVDYCSPRCAKAQAMRELRRRQRQETPTRTTTHPDKEVDT